MIEIERKFLVKSTEFKSNFNTKTKIVQGFLNSHKNRTVRVRLRGNCGFLTVKGKSSANGLSRFEWETKITVTEAEALLQLCENGVIEKYRYEVIVGKHTFEVDEFLGDNQGLIVAEVELTTEDEIFESPNWLGEEVTGVVKYYNSQLSLKPYLSWG